MVMVPDRTMMAAYRSTEVVRLDHLEPRPSKGSIRCREGKDTAAAAAAYCLKEADQQGTRWKRPQSRYDFYFL